MKSQLLSVLVITTLLSSSLVFAREENRSYLGFQYAQSRYTEDDIDDVEPTAAVVRAGIYLTDHISAELRLADGLDDDDVEFQGQNVDVDIENFGGIYAAYHLDTDFQNSFYGVLGYTEAEITATLHGETEHEKHNSFSAGLGFNFYGVNIEYMQYTFADDFEFATLSLGYLFTF
jgi:hypothetical protein